MKGIVAGLLLSIFFCIPTALQAGEIVDLNTVTEAHLMDLPTGLNETQVKGILKYRDTHGAFTKPEDLKKIPEMDEEIYTQLYPFLLNDTIVVEVEIPKGVSPY